MLEQKEAMKEVVTTLCLAFLEYPLSIYNDIGSDTACLLTMVHAKNRHFDPDHYHNRHFIIFKITK